MHRPDTPIMLVHEEAENGGLAKYVVNMLSTYVGLETAV
jgi:hypothetical protein